MRDCPVNGPDCAWCKEEEERMKQRSLEEERLAFERAHHAKLDLMAGLCGERTAMNRSHVGCAYCDFLVETYKDERVRLSTRRPIPNPCDVSGGGACTDDGRGICTRCGVALVACGTCKGVGYHFNGCADGDEDIKEARER